MKQTIRQTCVLLVDDDEEDYLIVKSYLAQVPGKPFKLDWESKFNRAQKCIAAAEHDVYLIDYRLGERNGLELIAEADALKREEPFIVLTGAGDEEIERLAMRLGVSDYLVKGKFDGESLSRTIRYAQQRKQLESSRIQYLTELNKTKDEFISLASHQLRTPATSVKQYIGMLLEGFLGDIPEEQRIMLSRAYDSNERQLQTVNDLLKVARADAGTMVLERRPVVLEPMIADVLDGYVSTFRDRQQDSAFEGKDHETTVLIDENQLRMVIENIIDNASKYSEVNTIISVAVEQQKDTVDVRISDQGVGIKKEDLGRLFQKFSRIDNSRSTIVGGSGLGLYWAKHVVDLHEGKITVDSEQGKGTTFTIKLPILHSDAGSPFHV